MRVRFLNKCRGSDRVQLRFKVKAEFMITVRFSVRARYRVKLG